jgi:hypothetical protein
MHNAMLSDMRIYTICRSADLTETLFSSPRPRPGFCTIVLHCMLAIAHCVVWVVRVVSTLPAVSTDSDNQRQRAVTYCGGVSCPRNHTYRDPVRIAGLG